MDQPGKTQQATGEPSTWPDYTPEFRSLTAAEQSSLRNLYRKLYKPVVAQQPTDGALREALEREILLRRELWLSHGHLGIYGDDGEMQCGECGIDYKRDSVDQILKRRYENGLRALAVQTTKEPK